MNWLMKKNEEKRKRMMIKCAGMINSNMLSI
jgi:hypothetical protein